MNRATRDLQIAMGNLGGLAVFPDAAVFFAQQTAEKALKAFLTAHDHPFPKTHNLEPLVEWSSSIDEEMTRLADAARILSPYAVRFRYPGGPMEPEIAEAQEAVRLAAEIVQAVQERLSPPASP